MKLLNILLVVLLVLLIDFITIAALQTAFTTSHLNTQTAFLFLAAIMFNFTIIISLMFSKHYKEHQFKTINS